MPSLHNVLRLVSVGLCLGTTQAQEKTDPVPVPRVTEPQTVSEIDAELNTLKLQAAQLEKDVLSKWICSHDLARVQEELGQSRAELKQLSAQQGRSKSIDALKKKIAGQETELSEYGKLMERTTVAFNENRKRTAELLMARERLAKVPPPAAADNKRKK